MFKKIRSNRDPGRTVLLELYQEFRPYVVLFRQKLAKFLKAHPKPVFTVMVFSILLSCLFSWGIIGSKSEKGTMKNSPITSNSSSKNNTGIENGLSKISATSSKLRKTIEIRQQVDSVLDKGSLSSLDSLFLESKLEELRKLQ